MNEMLLKYTNHSFRSVYDKVCDKRHDNAVLWRCREAGSLDIRHYECDFNSLFSANNDDHGNMIIPPHCK